MKKVAIVGTEVTSRGYTPWDDYSWEIWACSTPAVDYPRVTELFELHNIAWHLELGMDDILPSWLEKASKMDSVWVARANPLLPRAKILPRDELLAEFGPYFFTSTPAWMMAKAIHDKAEHIGLFGISMSAASEYAFQRPGMQYFMQVCFERGIRVSAPMESDILQPPPQYGYREFEPLFRKMDAARKNAEARLEHNRAEQHTLVCQEQRLIGALERINYDAQTFSLPEPKPGLRIVEQAKEPRLVLPGGDFVGKFVEGER